MPATEALLLSIPERHRPALRTLVSLEQESFDLLKSHLAAAEPTTSPDVLTSAVARDVSIPIGELRAIVTALFSLALTREQFRVSTARLVRDVTLRATEDGIVPDGEEVEKLKQRLESLLSLDRSVGVSSKALSIQLAHEHVFVSAQVLSDIRPVFSGNEQPEVLAAMIVHNLRLEVHANDEHVTFIAALDSSDLIALREVVERAIRKDATLRRTLEHSGIAYVDDSSR